MNLTAYLHPGWSPLIRPAPPTRPWMDATAESFAYRCLPLNIANAHGWEILAPFGFEAVWDGGTSASAVKIALDPGADPQKAPVSLFGEGVLTFHVEAIIRTAPGWNLWVGGSPNRPKDAIAPLTGVVETDWSPFTFTMNWRFTRPRRPIRFEANEPFCFLFPVERSALDGVTPSFAPLADDAATEARFKAWSSARETFHAKMMREPPRAPAERWQKHYYRGVDVDGNLLAEDHQSKLRLKPFDRSRSPGAPVAVADDRALPERPAQPDAEVSEVETLRAALAKREWLLETLERQRDLGGHRSSFIERRIRLGSEEFLERYYAPARPVIVTDELSHWDAVRLWTPEYLKRKIGPALVEYQDERASDPKFEIHKARHKRQGPFDAFIDAILAKGVSNDTYMTASNSELNRKALEPLSGDMGVLDKFLAPNGSSAAGMMWIGPPGTLTSLHHDLTNNLIVQLVGRKQVKILPASEVGRLHNQEGVFSRIADLEDPDLDLERFARLAGARVYDVVLSPGEILFLPLAWWHQVRALDFSVTTTFTNFRWPNDGFLHYPGG